MREAIDYADRAIEAAKYRGECEIDIIVGSPFLLLNRWTVLRMIEGFVYRSGFAFQ